MTKILGDDLVTDDQGQVQLAQGTAPERIISITDPDMRYVSKSAARRFNWFKAVLVTEQSSELLLDIADAPAPGSDGRQLLPALQRAEAAADVTIAQVLVDGACGSGEIRATCADRLGHAVDLVAPVAQAADLAVAKTAFQIDLAAQTATCPQGQTVAGQPGKMRRAAPFCVSPVPAPPARPTHSHAACAARPRAAPCAPTPMRSCCKRPGVDSKLPSSRRCTFCTTPSSAKGPNWSATACAICVTWGIVSGSSSASGSAPST
ncbi:MAG: hypothetical protein WHX53_14790 [Anaerolineae bacterium]